MGRRGPPRNGWLEALIVAVQARAWAARGKWLSLTELSEIVDLVACVCAPEAATEDVADAVVRLIELVGDSAWVRALVRAWRAWPPDVHAERDVAAVVVAGQGRRIVTLHKYQRGAAGLMAVYLRALVRRQARVDALAALAETAPAVAGAVAARWRAGVAPPPPPPPPPARPRWRGRWQRVRAVGCARQGGGWPASASTARSPGGAGDGEMPPTGAHSGEMSV
jgi:hypothetical protein